MEGREPREPSHWNDNDNHKVDKGKKADNVTKEEVSKRNDIPPIGDIADEH